MELEDTASDDTSSDDSVVLVSACAKPQSRKTSVADPGNVDDIHFLHQTGTISFSDKN